MIQTLIQFLFFSRSFQRHKDLAFCCANRNPKAIGRSGTNEESYWRTKSRIEEGISFKRFLLTYSPQFQAKDDLEEARKLNDNIADNPTPVPPPSSADKKGKADARMEKSGSSDRAKRQVQQLTEQNERLRKDLNTAAEAEKGLMREMEYTAQSVEDLMNQV